MRALFGYVAFLCMFGGMGYALLIDLGNQPLNAGIMATLISGFICSFGCWLYTAYTEKY